MRGGYNNDLNQCVAINNLAQWNLGGANSVILNRQPLMLNLILITFFSFLFTFLISIPFINLLYKFNIRRIPKEDLRKVLPGRKVKMGTPVMGGAVIVLSILLFSTIFLRDWEYYPAVILISIFGAIIGGIDEYINTLGRTIKAIRISRSSKTKSYSFIKAGGFLLAVKKVLLIPWKAFEEFLRASGSTQRGLKSHYKFLMHIFLVLIPILYLYKNAHLTFTQLPYLGDFQLGWLYLPFILFLLLGYPAAFGITDGMDGLSAGTHSIAFLAYGILAFYLGYTDIAYLSFIILGAELAFLYFNIYPARMEMSDVGTVPLGVLFVLIAALMHVELILPLVGVIFTIEIISSFAQQWSVKLRGKRIFLVAPIHHHFEKLGWHETKVTMRFWLVGIIGALLGLIFALV